MNQANSQTPQGNAESTKLSAQDALLAALLLLGGLFYTLPFLSEPEFLRHTEADRALIAWDMYKSGNFLVPTMFGDLYLTKPPLYYQLMSLSYSLFGGVSEFSARFVSALFASLLIAIQFLFCRSLSWSRETSFLASLALAASAQFFMYSVQSEMDMSFAALSSTGLYVFFHALKKRSLSFTALAYLIAAAAFLLKGPQIVVFFALGFFSYCAGCKLSELPKLVLLQVLGALLWLLIIYGWLAALASEVGWDLLAYHFDEELLRRFVDDSNSAGRTKPWYFYLERVPSGMLPWSLALFCIPLFWKDKGKLLSPSALPAWLRFSLGIVILSVLLFSFSSGKSARYLFPVYPCLALIIAKMIECSPTHEKSYRVFNWFLCRFAALLSFVALAAALASQMDLPIPASVSIDSVRTNLLICGAALFLSSALLAFRAYKSKNFFSLLPALALFLVSFRLPYGLVYSSINEQKRSMRSVSAEVAKLTPADKEVYLIAMFERWIGFYLKLDAGREVLRLTPKIVERLISEEPEESSFVLIQVQKEGWRREELLAADANFEAKALIPSYKRSFALLEVQNKDLASFSLSDNFPTEMPPVPKRIRERLELSD